MENSNNISSNKKNSENSMDFYMYKYTCPT